MDTHITETRTIPLTDRFEHPVKDFLKKAGLEASQFPRLSFIFESDDPHLRTGRHYLPIRLPAQPGWLFESFYRVTRILEVPHAQAEGHRTFVQIEWEILEAPVVDELPHEAIPFLTGETLCTRCREVFTVDPEIVDATTVSIKCPHCLAKWNVQSRPELDLENHIEFLLDRFHECPTAFQKKVAEWRDGSKGPEDLEYYEFFPIQFEKWSDSSSLDLLFENRSGWITYSNGRASGVDGLFRSFINDLALKFLSSQRRSQNSELENTEIQRKSEITIQTKTQTNTTAVARPRAMASEFRPITKVSMDVSWNPTDSAGALASPVRERQSFSSPEQTNKVFYYAAFTLATLFFSLIGWNAFQTANIQTFTRGAEILKQKLVLKSKSFDATTQALTKAPEPKQEVKQEVKEEVKVSDKPTVAKKEPVQEETELQEEIPIEAVVVASQDSKTVRDIKESNVANLEAKRKEAEARLLQEKVEAGYQQGMLHLKLQQASKAAEEFEKVIDLNPKHVETYRNLGLAYVYDHRFDQAITAFETYLKLAGNSFDRESVQELLKGLKSR